MLEWADMRARTRSTSSTKKMPQNRLGVFVRNPVAGEVKTRLSPALSPEDACNLYSAFVADLASRLASAGYRPTMFVSGEPSPSLPSLVDPKWPVVPQVEGPLGHRLAVAFEHLLRSPGGRAIIIGTDSPDLPLAYLKRAFQRLKHRDVVIGPAMDGGYYLIGLRAPAPSLFANIAWGTSKVFAQTLDAIEREGLSLALAGPWYDIDEADSLHFFAVLQRARAMAGAQPLPHSARVMASQGD